MISFTAPKFLRVLGNFSINVFFFSIPLLGIFGSSGSYPLDVSVPLHCFLFLPHRSSVFVPFPLFPSLRQSRKPRRVWPGDVLPPPLASCPISLLLTSFCFHHSIFLTSLAGGCIFVASSHKDFLSLVRKVRRFSLLFSIYSSIFCTPHFSRSSL